MIKINNPIFKITFPGFRRGLQYYWQFNYDAPGQAGLFLQSHFEHIIFPQCLHYTVHPTVVCLKFRKLFLCFYDIRSVTDGLCLGACKIYGLYRAGANGVRGKDFFYIYKQWGRHIF